MYTLWLLFLGICVGYTMTDLVCFLYNLLLKKVTKELS